MLVELLHSDKHICLLFSLNKFVNCHNTDSKKLKPYWGKKGLAFVIQYDGLYDDLWNKKIEGLSSVFIYSSKVISGVSEHQR